MSEGRVQAKLQHPNVLALTDTIEAQGSPGLVKPLVPDPHLHHHDLDLVEAEHNARAGSTGCSAPTSPAWCPTDALQASQVPDGGREVLLER